MSLGMHSLAPGFYRKYFKPEELLTQQENLKLECLSGLSLDLTQGKPA